MRFRCRACGREYNYRPDKCEEDGLSDFEVIETGPDGSRIIITGKTELFRIEIEKEKYDLLEIDPLKKFEFAFAPAGKEFPVSLPLNVIFSNGDVTMSTSGEKEKLQIQFALKCLLTPVKGRKDGEESFTKIDPSGNSSGDYFVIEISNNEEISFNGLTIKYLA